jgi:Domain of unknown function (DUF5666)
LSAVPGSDGGRTQRNNVAQRLLANEILRRAKPRTADGETMKHILVALGAAAALLAAPAGDAQTATRIRGTILAVDATTMTVQSREGARVVLRFADDVTVAVAKAVRFDDIVAGDYVGTTTRRAADGTDVALEVHYLAPTVRPGQSASDLEPEARMTNANVRSKVVGTGRRELTLEVAGREHAILVPDGVPIVRTVPGTRADLVPGEYVFVSGQSASDGTLTALRVQVSKDGVRPPQ